MYLTPRSSALRNLTALLRRNTDRRSKIDSLTERSWEQLIALANDHLLTAMLHDELVSENLLEAIPPDIHEYLALLYRMNAERNEAIRRQIADLAGALAGVEIRPLFLKGAATLFDGPYPGPGARMVRDIDLLVSSDSLGKCLSALRTAGYELVRRYPDTHNAYGDFAKVGEPAAIDLHIEPIDTPHLLHASELASEARSIACGRHICLVPSRTYRVLHNLLHAEIHDVGGYYHGRLPLRDLHEFGVLCETFRAEIDWEFLIDRMAENRMSVVLHSYVLAAQRLFGFRFPVSIAEPMRPKLHYARQIVQFHVKWLGRVALPWWNIRAAFAHHRMKALYGQLGGAPMVWRIRHGCRYLANNTLKTAKSRLLRL